MTRKNDMTHLASAYQAYGSGGSRTEQPQRVRTGVLTPMGHTVRGPRLARLAGVLAVALVPYCIWWVNFAWHADGGRWVGAGARAPLPPSVTWLGWGATLAVAAVGAAVALTGCARRDAGTAVAGAVAALAGLVAFCWMSWVLGMGAIS